MRKEPRINHGTANVGERSNQLVFTTIESVVVTTGVGSPSSSLPMLLKAIPSF